MKEEFYIETGQKSVMFTLWVSRKLEANDVVMPLWKPFNFIKNLSQDKDKAIIEAELYAKDHYGIFTGINTSPECKRGQTFEIEGVILKRGHLKYDGDKKPRFSFWGVPTEAFWKAWRERKEELKTRGLSVKGFKQKGGCNRCGEAYCELHLDWIVFYNPPNYNPLRDKEIEKCEVCGKELNKDRVCDDCGLPSKDAFLKALTQASGVQNGKI